MSMNQRIIDLKSRLKARRPRLVFPEGDNPIIQQAAGQLANEGVIQPILLQGDEAIAEAANKLQRGEADAMVAGIDHPTKDVIRASLKTVGLAPNVKYASSFFIMDIGGYAGGEDGLLFFADCSIKTPYF